MVSWGDLEAAEPGFAKAVRERFDAFRHKTMATLRSDGSPRISGIEATLRDGEMWIGAMPGSLKARDLQRDPRVALHSGSADYDQADPSSWAGDAKVSGRAVEVTDPAVLARFVEAGDEPPGPFHLFRIDLAEAVRVHVGDPPDKLVIEHWHEGRGLQVVERA